VALRLRTACVAAGLRRSASHDQRRCRPWLASSASSKLLCPMRWQRGQRGAGGERAQGNGAALVPEAGRRGGRLRVAMMKGANGGAPGVELTRARNSCKRGLVSMRYRP
jgi:hypothetical protein